MIVTVKIISNCRLGRKTLQRQEWKCFCKKDDGEEIKRWVLSRRLDLILSAIK